LPARIGKGPEDFDRFGEPITEFFDNEGHGVRVYRPAPFKEVRVYFADGKSVLERYMLPADSPKNSEGKEALFNALRRENGEENCYIESDGSLRIGWGEPDRELKFVHGDRGIRSY